jgi:hypothetical protein
MVKQESSHEWLARFCAHLIELRPSLHFTSAVQLAVKSYPYAARWDPELAAEVLLQIQQRVSRKEQSHGKGDETERVRRAAMEWIDRHITSRVRLTAG